MMKANHTTLALRRMEVHLAQNHYEACRDILRDLEAQYRESLVLNQERRDELECIANLPIELRWINILERAGYIYLSDLDGIDIRRIHVPQMASIGKHAVYNAVRKARKEIEKDDKEKEAVNKSCPL